MISSRNPNSTVILKFITAKAKPFHVKLHHFFVASFSYPILSYLHKLPFPTEHLSHYFVRSTTWFVVIITNKSCLSSVTKPCKYDFLVLLILDNV